MSKIKAEKNYFDRVHRWGIFWNFGALLVLFSVPVAISAHYTAWPALDVLLSVLVKLMPIYWISGVIEVVTYVPMLGAGGTYLSFVTGNISNLKLPCGLAAMENAKVKANTEEGDVITTIAIGVSSIVTTIIIAAGVVAFIVVGQFVDLDAILDNETIKPAFDQVLPALFGALAASYFAKHWKIVFAPVIVGVIVLIFAPTLGAGTLMFATIVAALAGVGVMYKLNWL